ncbi:MAG: hypothetical protein R3185_01635 [Candidatus Thermoplasmatota archaeon]|nr:hypothetical protein [Candidatus Thermoplasmatota archaeon]
MSEALPFWAGTAGWLATLILMPLVGGTIGVLVAFVGVLAISAGLAKRAHAGPGSGMFWGFIGYSVGMLVWLGLVMAGAVPPA